MTGFECKLDSDIEEFIRTKAIPYEKAHKCRTYLFLGSDFFRVPRPMIIAYLSIALSNTKLNPDVSNTMKKRMDGIFKNDEAPCYLIGQIAKNDRYPGEIDGRDLIECAIKIIRIGHKAVGGRFIRVDIKNNEKLIRFYEENGFNRFTASARADLIPLVRFL